MQRRMRCAMWVMAMAALVMGVSSCTHEPPQGREVAPLAGTSSAVKASPHQAAQDPNTELEGTGVAAHGQAEGGGDAELLRDRQKFEEWNLGASPDAPRNEDEVAVLEVLQEVVVTEMDIGNLAFIPAPDAEREDLPDYAGLYAGETLAVYRFQERGVDRMSVLVGPPQAGAWFVAEMERVDGEWVLQRATDPEGSGTGEVVYERGRGFIETETSE